MSLSVISFRSNLIVIHNFKTLCDGMKTMRSENRFAISSISEKGWIKIIEHNGTMELGKDPKLHNYDINHCPFCGVQIEEQLDPINESNSN